MRAKKPHSIQQQSAIYNKTIRLFNVLLSLEAKSYEHFHSMWFVLLSATWCSHHSTSQTTFVQAILIYIHLSLDAINKAPPTMSQKVERKNQID